MTSTRLRAAAAALTLVTALSVATAGTAVARPKKPAPAPPAAVAVLPQVQLRVNPIVKTAAVTDHAATVTVKAPAGAAVSGTYRLLDGGVVLSEGALVRGTGAVVVDLAPGVHRLVAVYSGSAKVNSAATKVVEVVVPTP